MRFFLRPVVLMICAFFTLALCSAYLFVQRDEMGTRFFSIERPLIFPDLVARGANGGFYLVENGWKSVVCADTRGNVRFSLRGGSRSDASFYEAWYITADESGFLYMVNVVRDLGTGAVTKEEIRRYRPDGSFDKTLRVYRYLSIDEPGSFDTSGRLIAPKAASGKIRYLYRASEELIYVMEIDIASGAESVMMALPSGINPVDAVYFPDSIAVTARNGRLLRISGQGAVRDEGLNGDIYIPGPIDADAKGAIYIADLGTHRIVKSGADGIASVLTPALLNAQHPGGREPLFRSLAADSAGNLVSVDESNNTVVCRNAATGRISVINSVRISAETALIRISLLAAAAVIVLTVFFIGYLFYRDVLKRRVPLLLKFALLFMPVFMISIVVIGTGIFRMTNAAYEDETRQKLLLLAQTGAKLVDGNALARLSKPAHFMNSDYQLLQSQMSGVLGENRDAWNRDLYSVLYKNIGGIYYYTVDLSGYYGVLYPYARVQQIHRDAFENGTTGCTKYRDAEGEWICAASPVRDTSGSIVGVYEVGANYFLHREISGSAKRHLAAGLGIASAIQLGLFLLFSFIMLRWLRMLNNAGRQIAEGNYDIRVRIRSRDEIEDLGREFNTMAEKIRLSVEELKFKNEALTAMDRIKDEFLANTSHELRTPLNGIIGLAEGMLDAGSCTLDEKQRRTVSMIYLSGRRLLSLVNDILDFEKLRNRDIALSLSAVDVRGAADIVIALTAPLAAAKNLSLVNDIPAAAPLVEADEDRLMQILHNLIGNAVKFTDAGSIRISAKVCGGMLEIWVTDTGIGIGSQDIDRIFESFEQLDGSATRTHGGTGLGLSITKKLVELHGGSIRVESEPGRGTSFIFTVPVTSRSAPDASGRASSPRLVIPDLSFSPSASAAQGEYRILAVDDDPVNLEVLTGHLAAKNYSVTIATSGKEALSFIENGERFDLILLDIMMPRLSGYEVARSLREKFKLFELPIIMLTAKNQIHDIVAGFETGVNDYLTKPFNKYELLSRVENLLSLQRAVRESARLNAIEQELSIARDIQMSILPKKEIQVQGVSCSFSYIPMESVGGDFYDYVLYGPRSFGIITADVTGHGIPAALIASMLKVAFHFEASSEKSPAKVLQNINTILAGKFRHGYITAAFAHIDLETKLMTVSTAAHPSVLVLDRRTGSIDDVRGKGKLMGFLPDIGCTETAFMLEQGDRIVFYTDGITEARNPDGEMFDEDRFREALRNSRSLDADSASAAVLGAVRSWSTERTLEDDVTLVIVDIE